MVNFGNLNTKEVVFEVVEGHITQVNIQFLDKLGNVVEGNTHFLKVAVVKRELPKPVLLSSLFFFLAWFMFVFLFLSYFD